MIITGLTIFILSIVAVGIFCIYKAIRGNSDWLIGIIPLFFGIMMSVTWDVDKKSETVEPVDVAFTKSVAIIEFEDGDTAEFSDVATYKALLSDSYRVTKTSKVTMFGDAVDIYYNVQQIETNSVFKTNGDLLEKNR
jgi:hypothetical protein